MTKSSRKILFVTLCAVLLPLTLGSCKSETQTINPAEQVAAPPIEDEVVWTPEMEAANGAREECVLALNGKLDSSPNLPDSENMPQRTESGWTWTSYAEDLGVRTDFTCTTTGEGVSIDLN